MSEYNVPRFDVNFDPAGFVVDVNSLYAYLSRLHDARDPRGLRYSLVTVLLLVVLAKLAGEDRLSGITEWARHRQQQLAEALQLKTVRAPCLNTYRNVLGHLIDLHELEQVVHDFFAAQPGAGQSVVISVDGKTLRGTLPRGHSHGLHLLAAYLPQEGWVLAQVEVSGKENEIPAAARVLKTLDLRGKIVTGDALLSQRRLSVQIVQAGGDYLWRIKENQVTVYQDLVRLFATEPTIKGFSPASHDDFRSARTFDHAHGRKEWRAITVSQIMKGYLDWPGVEQVFRIERRSEGTDGHVTQQVVYGVTSLTATTASPSRLLALVRQHWEIENGLFYRRDETLREDWCHVTRGQTAHALAIINNLIIGLMRRQGGRNLPQVRRYYDAHPQAAINAVLGRPN